MNNQSNKNKISFLVYENQKSPKYFEFSRTILKAMIIGLPALTILSILILIVGVLSFKQILVVGKSTTPRIINELRAEKAEFVKKQTSLLSVNSSLQRKLSKQNFISAGPEVKMFGFFNTPAKTDNMKMDPNLFLLEDVRITPSRNKIFLKFNLVNNTPNRRRLEGYLFITLKSKNSIHFYPPWSMSSDELQINYNRGESFSTSRFRPVITEFPSDGKPGKALFHVYTFSKKGSLMFVNSFSANIKNYQIGTTIKLHRNSISTPDTEKGTAPNTFKTPQQAQPTKKKNNKVPTQKATVAPVPTIAPKPTLKPQPTPEEPNTPVTEKAEE